MNVLNELDLTNYIFTHWSISSRISASYHCRIHMWNCFGCVCVIAGCMIFLFLAHFDCPVIGLNYLKKIQTHMHMTDVVYVHNNIHAYKHTHASSNHTIIWVFTYCTTKTICYWRQHYTIHIVIIIIYCVDLFKNSRISSDFNLNNKNNLQ